MKLIYNKHFKTTNTDKSAEQLLEKHEKVTDNCTVESVISLFNTEIMLRMDLLLASLVGSTMCMFLITLCDVELYINKCFSNVSLHLK